MICRTLNENSYRVDLIIVLAGLRILRAADLRINASHIDAAHSLYNARHSRLAKRPTDQQRMAIFVLTPESTRTAQNPKLAV